MSDQPLCERSSRTGVRSTRIGKSASSDSRWKAPPGFQRVLVNIADAKHPSVALAAPDRPPHLIGEVLEGDLLIGLGQAHCKSRRWGRLASSPPGKPRSLAHSDVPSGPGIRGTGSAPTRRPPGHPGCRNGTSCGGTRTPAPLVEVAAVAPELLELLASPQLLIEAGIGHQLADRSVPDGRIGMRNRLNEELA